MNLTSSYEYVTGAALISPYNKLAKSLKELAVQTTLTLGLMVAADTALQELRSPGYVRQSAPRWTISTMRDTLVSNDAVEFPISWVDTKPRRLTLFSDGTPVASGELEAGNSYPAGLSGAKIVFPRGAISIRSW